MTKSKGLSSCLGVNVAELKVMCGLAHDPSTLEEKAVEAVDSDPIPAEKFLSVFRQRRQVNQLAIEFKALSRNQETHTTHAALRNVLLNVKQETVPYDHSQVIIWDRPDSLGTDYYNASYIDGYTGPKEYIACQGPNKKCLVSFWHMIWQERVTCVVMATGLFENAMIETKKIEKKAGARQYSVELHTQQCDKYWMDNTETHVQHGCIRIRLTGRIRQAQLNVRTFKIQKEGSCELRDLTHYEMVGFHDEGADPGLLLDVRRRVRSKCGPQDGPILVHCRCGGGRTAVFVAVDLCLQQLQSEDRVDVYSTVLHLRRFRKNMVRTLSQYTQIYCTVALHIQCGLTVYPVSTLPHVFQLHYSRGADTKHQKMEQEFQTLHSIMPRLSVGDCASGHRVENRCKNRDIMMLPPERARPYLVTADCGDFGTDFINAAFVDGYHAENMFIVTQWPMRKTIGDLWRLIFDFKMTSLVFMNDPLKFSRSYPRFWPKDTSQVATYGPINVTYLSCERGEIIVVRTFVIRKVVNNQVGRELRRDERVVRMFQVVSSGRRGSDMGYLSRNTSPCNDKPHSRSCSEGGVKDREKSQRHGKWLGIDSRSLMTVMEHVANWQKCSSSKQPVCLISKDGCSHVGIYCAVALCCDQAKEDREVDVFNAVRRVRRHRPQLVPTIEEYRYIYRFMTEFLVLLEPQHASLVSEPSINAITHSICHHHTTTATTTSSSSAASELYNRSTCHNYASLTGSTHLSLPNKNTNCRVLPTCSKTLSNNDNGHCYYDNDFKHNGMLAASGNALPYRVDSGDGPCFLTEDLLQESSCLSCRPQIVEFKTIEIDSIKEHLQFINWGLSSSVPAYTENALTNEQTLPSKTSGICFSQCSVNFKMHLLSNPGPSFSPPVSGSTQSVSPASCTTDHTTVDNDQICSSPDIHESKLGQSSTNLYKGSPFVLLNSQNNLNRHCVHKAVFPNLADGDVHFSEAISRAVRCGCSSEEDTKFEFQPEKCGRNNNSSVHPMPSRELQLLQLKMCTSNNGCDKATLIHASYASMDEDDDDQTSGSADEREYCSSFESVERDKKIKKVKPCNKLNFLLPPVRRKVKVTQPTTQIENNEDQPRFRKTKFFTFKT